MSGLQPIVALGRFWQQRVATGEDPCEIDAVASGLIATDDPGPLFALCARERITGDLPADTLVVTANEAFD